MVEKTTTPYNFTDKEIEEKKLYSRSREGDFWDLYLTPGLSKEDQTTILEWKFKCMFHVPIPECEEYYLQAKKILLKYYKTYEEAEKAIEAHHQAFLEFMNFNH